MDWITRLKGVYKQYYDIDIISMMSFYNPSYIIVPLVIPMGKYINCDISVLILCHFTILLYFAKRLSV